MRRLLDLRLETPAGSVGRALLDQCVELYHQALAANDEAPSPCSPPLNQAPQAYGVLDPP